MDRLGRLGADQAEFLSLAFLPQLRRWKCIYLYVGQVMHPENMYLRTGAIRSKGTDHAGCTSWSRCVQQSVPKAVALFS